MKLLFSGLALFAAAVATAAPADAATVVLGGYPDQLQFINDVTGKVTDKVTLDEGLPNRIQLSSDGSKIYVTTMSSGIEVVDARSHKVLNHFTLNGPLTRYRLNGMAVDPSGRYLYAIGHRIDKLIDRYRFGKPQYFAVDLQEKKVIRSADVDEKAKTGGRPRLQVSPDGKSLYVFGKKIEVLNVADFKVAKTIDLSRPEMPWKQDVNMGDALDSLRGQKEYVSLYESRDPYIHNKIFGIARFDLATQDVTYRPVGAEPQAIVGLQVTPDGQDAYTVVVNGDAGSRRCEFWHYNLTTAVAVAHAEFACRRRFYFGMSHDGSSLYIYGAGYDVASYDAKTLKYRTDWELGNDITMAGIITLP
ncbi:hypothetical protein ACMAUO_08105 [Gluconacetobacter sp. Hr-1-5]|uniref:hypothetical protein n=1 Tax=Gluconacetobacter sp. Hr-1-5 TaxID=3395370 RepID=UPI003B530288